MIDHQVFFSLHFRPVGQGLFSHGNLQFNLEETQAPFEWVYDCGAKNLGMVKNQVAAYKIHNDASIDLLMISHFHCDHILGIRDLLENSSAKIIVMPYLSLAERLAAVSASSSLNQNYINFLLNPAGTLLELKPTARIVFILPGGGQPPQQSNQDNTNPDWPPRPPDRENRPDKSAEGSIARLTEADADLDLQRSEVFKIDGSKPLLVENFWEFCFYNIPRPEMEASLLEKIDPILAKFEKTKRKADDYENLVLDLKEAFKEVRGSGKKPEKFDANEISLVVYSGPSSREKDVCRRDSIPWIVPSNISPLDTVISIKNWPPPRSHKESRCATLFTGDITLTDEIFLELKKHFGDPRIDFVAYFQVPHHGAAPSFQLSPKQIQPDYSIFSSDRHHFGYDHPSDRVITALGQCGPLFVNEFQGLTTGGFLYRRLLKAIILKKFTSEPNSVTS